MNKIYVVIFLTLLSSSTILAQYNAENDGHYSQFRPGIGWFFSGFKPYEAEKLRKYDRLMVDIVYNDWYGDQGYFSSPWPSIGFNVSWLFDVVLTKKNTISFGWGIGYSHYNNASDLQFNRDLFAKTTTAVEFSTGNKPTRSKFGANYVEIPLEFRFRTPGFKHFKFMVGGKIGYRINSLTKEVNRIDGKNYATKKYNFPDANPLRYGATVRIGIRNWALYGAYYFSPLFTSGESSQLTPFSIGLTISLF